MMKFLLAPAVLLSLSVAPAIAQAGGPLLLGKFGNWTAASYGNGAGRACYAFTTASSSSLALAKRGAVLLTVTRRGAAKDEVTLAAGYAYPKAATVTLTVGASVISFYTSGPTAFTTGGKPAVAAFQTGAGALAKSPGPTGLTVIDRFSLTGFSGAYGAIRKACP